ncbi:MAG TPA: sigma-70 family RNA polymerase sigma factor [Armatimonadota bacterium]|nr:sigma-70 family RNA polymerase sigma factor [Armatimonadota bacterium]
MSDSAEPEVPDHAHWLHALQRRESWAWDQLQSRTLDCVFGYVYLRCDRREDAEDITADVFASAVAAIDGFRGDARVETWLIGIARRKLIDAQRRRGRRPEVLQSDLGDGFDDTPAGTADAGPETPERALEARETDALVRRLVLQLPEAQREALWLHCVDELSVAETARLLRRSDNAVKGLLHRAKSALTQKLAAQDAAAFSIQENPHVEASLTPAVGPAHARSGK